MVVGLAVCLEIDVAVSMAARKVASKDSQMAATLVVASADWSAFGLAG